MAKSMSFKILGLQKANLYLKNSKAGVKRGTSKAMNKIALFMEDEVRQSITGHRNELKSFDTGNFSARLSSSSNSNSAMIKDGSGYGVHLEYETRGRPGRRHFRNSLARNKNKIKDYLNSQIKKSV